MVSHPAHLAPNSLKVNRMSERAGHTRQKRPLKIKQLSARCARCHHYCDTQQNYTRGLCKKASLRAKRRCVLFI